MYYYADAINLLINKFPELKPIYEDGIDDYMDLPYIFYEPVFGKYIIDKIIARNKSELSSIFDFVEDLLLNGDEDIKNLAEVAIIERLYSKLYFDQKFAEYIEFASKFYGELTKKSFDDYINWKPFGTPIYSHVKKSRKKKQKRLKEKNILGE